ncbi:hypothetical protein SmJEL517_g00396 [Synchytrium microbalum]|uniref:NodB homology domain-containing protein n=1 Tax=Synchytrium microbalum TaxID=1806994 RepID=A0A507CAA7_9FUNG|nr:uncharacterized protein SmJEL517_g00396 [Synchytrium microbalum]TPX38017.1 hypothetical protein SmJEL517_g00396 [Synchytrium microbalum]
MQIKSSLLTIFTVLAAPAVISVPLTTITVPVPYPQAIPVQPVAYPSADEKIFITGAFLSDKIVTDALAFVNSVVDPNILAILPSTYIQYSNVVYHDNAVNNCYWPLNGCVRATDVIDCQKDYQWGLTYDDAPTSNVVNGVNYNDSISILDSLNELKVKATFFVTGSQATYYAATLQTLANNDMHIAHHSWSHHPMTSLTNTQIVAEIMYTQAMIYKVTGLTTRYFRPPYGDIDDRVRGIIAALGFKIIIWDSAYDSTDADVAATPENYEKVMARIRSWFNVAKGFISLQHTISTFTSGTSVAALQEIIKMGGIKNQLMTVPQCIGDSQWYMNKNVNTVFNSCTLPGGCNGATVSPTASTAQASVVPSVKPSSTPSLSLKSTLSSTSPTATPSASPLISDITSDAIRWPSSTSSYLGLFTIAVLMITV